MNPAKAAETITPGTNHNAKSRVHSLTTYVVPQLATSGPKTQVSFGQVNL